MRLVHLLVLLVHLAHLFDLIEVDDEALFICMVFLNTLSAKDCEMIRAVEMLYALVVTFALEAVHAGVVLIVDLS